MVERGESLMSNLALSTGSDLDGLHDALSAGGGVYIWILPLGRPFLRDDPVLKVWLLGGWGEYPDERCFFVSWRLLLDP